MTTDGHNAYLSAVEDIFGGEIVYAMLVKIYGESSPQTGIDYSGESKWD